MASIDFPFVSKPLVCWSETSTQQGFVLSNFPVLSVNDDPASFFAKYDTVYLQPGATYVWKNIPVNSNLHLHGQGATVKLIGNGPILFVQPEETLPVNEITVYIEKIHFVGDDVVFRHQPMSTADEGSGAIWFHRVLKTTVADCIFENFKGAALLYSDLAEYWRGHKWKQQHSITGCKFDRCRIGITNTGGSEFALATSNHFIDCQICLNAIGGNWMYNNNITIKCRCAYLHIKDNMWYSNYETDNADGGKGTISNNVFCYSDLESLWPSTFKLHNGDEIALSAIYFDDDDFVPPTMLGNFHLYSSINLVNIPSDQLHKYSITGCSFYGNTSIEQDGNEGQIIVGENFKDSIFLIGCSGNDLTLRNVLEENVIPKFGTFK
ncbi:E1B [Odocoileus adenovirus 1]|nr:E1B [Odocoileus adenovirus 1]ASU50492.1 E1B [Odocoileus adenovirus 1]